MKFRNGFVSNSSSSSFICDVCSVMGSGWDVRMVLCVIGHVFCEGHSEKIELSCEQKKAILIDADSWFKKEMDKGANVDDLYHDYEYDVGVPKSNCPICSLKNLTDGDLVRYLVKKYFRGDKSRLKKEIVDKFSSFDEFVSWSK